jgi:hypothetical protein
MEMHADDRREHGLPPGLARPARRALAAAGIQYLEQLTTLTEAEIKRLHGIGPNALAQLRDALAAEGLSFAGTSVNGPN